MKILVANIGSTSFKYRLFEMGDATGGERELARGGADRIGLAGGKLSWTVAGGESCSVVRDCADHGDAVAACLDQLISGGVLSQIDDIAAVGFKAVVGGEGPAVCRVDEKLLARMEYYVPIAPAHNPPYIAAMRELARRMPGTPLVAALEHGYHETIPPRRTRYAVDPTWATQYGVRRYGYHGASHRYLSGRMAELTGRDDLRLISCHLGGSSSVCASRCGISVATSMGLSPQSGLPQGTRVGDFDPFALNLLARQTGMGLDAMLAALGGESGMAALSDTSGDAREIEQGADDGDEKCLLTIDIFATAVRDHIGAYAVELGGVDAIAFTGGIGEKWPGMRKAIVGDMRWLGVRLDDDANETTRAEGRIDAGGEAVQLWVVPTNEELIVARQTRDLLAQAG